MHFILDIPLCFRVLQINIHCKNFELIPSRESNMFKFKGPVCWYYIKNQVICIVIITQKLQFTVWVKSTVFSVKHGVHSQVYSLPLGIREYALSWKSSFAATSSAENMSFVQNVNGVSTKSWWTSTQQPDIAAIFSRTL